MYAICLLISYDFNVYYSHGAFMGLFWVCNLKYDLRVVYLFVMFLIHSIEFEDGAQVGELTCLGPIVGELIYFGPTHW